MGVNLVLSSLRPKRTLAASSLVKGSGPSVLTGVKADMFENGNADRGELDLCSAAFSALKGSSEEILVRGRGCGVCVCCCCCDDDAN